jgi:hypothetical protein
MDSDGQRGTREICRRRSWGRLTRVRCDSSDVACSKAAGLRIRRPAKCDADAVSAGEPAISSVGHEVTAIRSVALSLHGAPGDLPPLAMADSGRRRASRARGAIDRRSLEAEVTPPGTGARRALRQRVIVSPIEVGVGAPKHGRRSRKSVKQKPRPRAVPDR